MQYVAPRDQGCRPRGTPDRRSLHLLTAAPRAAESGASQPSPHAAHALYTPLTPIKGYVDLLLDGAFGDLTDAQQEALRTVKANTNRLLLAVRALFEDGLAPADPRRGGCDGKLNEE